MSHRELHAGGRQGYGGVYGQPGWLPVDDSGRYRPWTPVEPVIFRRLCAKGQRPGS